MDWLHKIFWKDGNFQWWEIVGVAGMTIFTSRFYIQWYATEKMKRVVVPMSFWWLSLIGSLLLLAYAIFAKPSLTYILSYAFAWIPYLRNIIIHKRHQNLQPTCPACSNVCVPNSKFCPACGASLAADVVKRS